jgi:tetratricopeptide (TPR) repeat protein
VAAALRGEVRHRRGYQELHPLDFGGYLAERRRDFVGRQWLFDRIDGWRVGRRERALLVTGEPGIGKSAAVAQLVHLNPGGQVLAYHCCRADDPDTTDPTRFVQGLAFQLASQLDAYAARLDGGDLLRVLADAACSADPAGAFEKAILAPLATLAAPPEGVRYVLLDALDEALVGRESGLNLVKLLAPRLERLPGWLRLVATSRPASDVRRRLGGVRSEPLDAGSEDNREDLNEYVADRLQTPDLAERLVASRRGAAEVQAELADKAAGNFLYAQQVLLGVELDYFGFDRLHALPPGLAGIYDAFFERLYPDEASYGPARRVLEVVVAAAQPLTAAQIAAAVQPQDDYEVPGVLRRLASYLPQQDGRHAVYHRSLEDWLRDADGRFHASPRGGHQALADAGWREYERDVEAMSPYALRHLPSHLEGAGDPTRRNALMSDVWYLFERGDYHIRVGETGPAREQYEQAHRVCQERVKRDPGNAGWQNALSVSYDRLGEVRGARGDLDGAEDAYQKSLEIARRLAESDPGNAGWQNDLSVSFNNLGDVRVARGDLDGARDAYGRALDIRGRLAESDPGNAGWQRGLSISHQRLGDVRLTQGDLAGAEDAFQKYLDIARRLAESDPGNAGWQRDLAVSYFKLSELHEKAGAPTEAERCLRQCWEIFSRMRAAGMHLIPSDVKYLDELDARFRP